MIDAQAAHRIGAVGNHAREVMTLGLFATEGLAFHGLGRNRTAAGKHRVMKLGRDLGEIRLNQLALIIC